MKITELLSKNRMNLSLNSSSKESVISELCNLMNDGNVLNDVAQYKDDIIAREKLLSTAIVPEIAIPHAKSKAVNIPALTLGISKKGIQYGDKDMGLTHVFFMIAAPDNADNAHLATLASLSVLLMNDSFKVELLDASTNDEIFAIVKKYESKKETSEKPKADLTSEKPLIIAVTACPTGIAHTYMAEEALLKAGKEMDVNIRVETNGTEGVKNRLTDDEIRKAKGVILAINRNVETARFDGKQLIQVDADIAIKEPKKLINQVLEGKLPIYHESSDNNSYANNNTGNSAKNIYKHLMSGGADFGSVTPLAKLFKTIGGSAFSLFVPILGAYIAYSISDRAGLAAGFVGGYLAKEAGAGFLGALVAGFIAGYVTKFIIYSMRNTPKSINGIKAILIFPVLSVLSVGIIMQLIINPPMIFLNQTLESWLNSMQGNSKILLGMIVAGMMAFDMGEPVNKAAYAFGATSLEATLATGVAVSWLLLWQVAWCLRLQSPWLHCFLKTHTLQKKEKQGVQTGLWG